MSTWSMPQPQLAAAAPVFAFGAGMPAPDLHGAGVLSLDGTVPFATQPTQLQWQQLASTINRQCTGGNSRGDGFHAQLGCGDLLFL
jgi:hypothetical protein